MGVVWEGGGGGRCNVFLTFYAISNIFFCMLEIERDSWNLDPLYPLFPCSDFVSQMWGGLGGGCNVFLTFYAISNIFLYAGNGRWFLQFVDIHVGNFNMKLTGRWFPQLVGREVGIYVQYIYYKNCGVSF